MYGASLKLDFDLGGGTLTSITAYDELEELLTGDQFDFLPIRRIGAVNAFFFCGLDQAQHQWLDVDAVSQEIRYTSPADERLRWIRRRLRHRDRPLHLDRQRVRFRHRRGPRGQEAARCRSSTRSSRYPRRLAGQPGLGGVRRDELRPHRPARGLGRAALRPRRAREHDRDAAGIHPGRSTASGPAARPLRVPGPGARGDLGRLAAEGDAALQADRRPDDLPELQPRLPQRRLQPDGRRLDGAGDSPASTTCSTRRRRTPSRPASRREFADSRREHER